MTTLAISMKDPFENEFGKYWIEDGISFFIYKQGSVVDLSAAKKIISDRKRFQNGAIYPLFTDIRGVKFFDKEARDYFANEGSSIAKCTAVIVDSPSSKLIGDFYVSVNKPVAPTRMFFDKKDAIEFLKNFI